jgi:hypothetical protein
MSTQFQHRILLIVPIAKVPAVVSWLQANVDPTCPNNLGPALNATGLASDPASHAWQSAAWTDAQCKALMAKLCQLAGVTPPTALQWGGWTGAQKRSWLAGVRAALRTGFGVYVQLSDGPGQWDDPADALAAMGLKPVTAILA